MGIGGNIPNVYPVHVYSVCWAGSDHYPLPHAGSFTFLNWLGGGTEREVKGRTVLGWGQEERGEGRRVGASGTSVASQ